MILSVINSTIDIMEVDAAQYASISYEMSQTGNYLQVYHHGHDYLDKPPLLFWMASLSISIFGNSNVGYKLPAIILLWLAIWATYKFGQLWYSRKVGIMAGLILGTTQAFHLMTNDVRTDGLLMSFVMLSVYFLSLYLKKGGLSSLILGGACLGGAMLSKGPVGYLLSEKTEDSDGNDYEFIDEITRIELGAHLGAGIAVGPVVIDVRYLLGITNLAKEIPDAEVHNTGFGGGVSLMF